MIRNQSQSRLRDDVLADALVISCVQGHHGVAHHLLAEEKAKADRVSESIEHSKHIPPLILAVKHIKEPFRDKPELAAAGRAVSEGFKTIRSLLEHGASLTGHDPDRRNVLSYAGRVEVAELLLAEREEGERQKALHDKSNADGNDALMWAVVDEHCSDSVALSYLKYGANMDTQDMEGRTILMNAAWQKRTHLVQLSLQDKSMAERLDKKGRNIWHHIASDKTRKERDDTSKFFFAMDESDEKVNLLDHDGQTSLHLSAFTGTKAIAEELLEKKSPPINAVERHEKKTALHFAAARGDADFVELLLRSGANRLARCDGGLLPLHLVCACDYDAVRAAKILLEDGIGTQLESQTEEKMTPLHIAAAHGNEDVVKSILEAQPRMDVDVPCEGGWTSLHLACGRHMSPSTQPITAGGNSTQDSENTSRCRTDPAPRYLAVVQALLTAGAKVNTKSRLSRTALHIAAEMGHVDIVTLLLQQDGIQFASKDSRGNTPLIDAAKSKNREEILRLLAPWNDLFVQSLPKDVKQAASDYDANVVDFEKVSDSKMVRHKVPVFNLLFKDFVKEGALGREHVSTRPDPLKKGAFRWIHLPANNLHWCHTLLTKHFIEGGFSADVESFKALERSLSQQQYRGRRIHSRFMRPAYTKLMRRSGDHGHVHHSPDQCYADELDIVSLRDQGRVNSTRVPEPKSGPPSPKALHTVLPARDLSGKALTNQSLIYLTTNRNMPMRSKPDMLGSKPQIPPKQAGRSWFLPLSPSFFSPCRSSRLSSPSTWTRFRTPTRTNFLWRSL